MSNGAQVFFAPVEVFSVRAWAVADALVGELRDVLPGDVEIAHIGATALPDGVTKGDVDLVVRTSAEDFVAARDALDRLFTKNLGSPRTDTFASYEVAGRVLPVGIQLVMRGAELDIFHTLHERLLGDAALRESYANLKRIWHGCDEDAYRDAKGRWFDEVLGQLIR